MAWLKKNKYLILLATLFLVQFLFISPIGEFPLNDDWVHAEMVEHWAKTNEFRLNPFTGPLFYTQLLYATALTKIFGFSFSLLRLTTLLITAGLTGGLFIFLKKHTKHESLAFLGALTIWLNPIVYELSFTFMTDIPALTCLLAAIIAFYTGFKKNQTSLFWAGSIITVLGFFIRQTNILLLPAVGLITLIRPPERKLKFWLAIIVPGLVAIGIYYWLSALQLIGGGIDLHTFNNTQELWYHAKWWSLHTTLYLALFVLPITLTTLKKKYFWHYLIAGGLGLFLTNWLHFFKQKTFPYVSNTINLFGLGPLSETLSGNFLPLFPPLVWLIVSSIAGIALGLLVISFWQIFKHREFYTSPQAFLALFCLFFAVPLVLFTGFDRYFLPLVLSVIILLIIENLEARPNWPSFSILIFLIVYGYSQTHFYLSWNRVRAELVANAFNQHQAKIHTLDSGYEWTGYHNYWSSLQLSTSKRGAENSPWWIKFLITNITREQVITATPLPGYTTVEQRQVPGLNPNNQLYLQIKNDDSNQK